VGSYGTLASETGSDTAAGARQLGGGGALMPSPETLLGVGPSEMPAKGGHLTLRVGVHPTPFGQALLALTERGVSSLVFLDPEEAPLQLDAVGQTPREAPPQPSPILRAARETPQPSPTRRTAREAPVTLDRALGELQRAWPGVPMVEDPDGTAATLLSVFYSGGAQRLGSRRPGGRGPEDRGSGGRTPLPLYVRGTDFQLQVWKSLLEVPPGDVTTYGGLAEAVGRPGAARAVGGAVAANPVAYLIPCHRVVRASGDLGGYRWGVERKRAMLEWEKAGAAGQG
jgi:AraC family transcriptional regulator, regulatory protein of adaptative response / methylated-DNA-[protein]-cysteine methyltransferase